MWSSAVPQLSASQINHSSRSNRSMLSDDSQFYSSPQRHDKKRAGSLPVTLTKQVRRTASNSGAEERDLADAAHCQPEHANCPTLPPGIELQPQFGKVKKQQSTIHSATQADRERKISVLVAEDTPVMRYVLVQALEEFGVNVVTVENGVEAVAAVVSARYDLVLMDIQMPRMSGLEATKTIRRLPIASQANIPIIAITCGAPGQERKDCIASGMDDFFLKPISTDQLREILIRWAGMDL